MDKFLSMAEQAIMKAMEEGDFENLKGYGKPLDLRSNPYMPDEWILSHRIYKNAGMLPPEVEAKRKIQEWRKYLNENELEMTEEEYKELSKKIQFAEIELNIKLDQVRKSG